MIPRSGAVILALAFSAGAQDTIAQDSAAATASIPLEARRAIVSVRVVETDPEIQEFMRRFVPDGKEGVNSHRGIGLIVSSEGDVITFADLPRRASERIFVRLDDGRELPARVLGHDRRTQIALLKVDGRTAAPLPIGDWRGLAVGDPVVAIGLRASGIDPFSAAGSVRALQARPGKDKLDDFIETNVGNVDGPILNARGEVIAVNVYYDSKQRERAFALPIDMTMWVFGQLKENRRVIRGTLGFVLQAVTPDVAKAYGLPSTDGVLVNSVKPFSPAEAAGMIPGDVLLKIDETQVRNGGDLVSIVTRLKPGAVVMLSVRRGFKPVTLQATVAELNPSFETLAPMPSKPMPQ